MPVPEQPRRAECATRTIHQPVLPILATSADSMQRAAVTMFHHAHASTRLFFRATFARCRGTRNATKRRASARAARSRRPRCPLTPIHRPGTICFFDIFCQSTPVRAREPSTFDARAQHAAYAAASSHGAPRLMPVSNADADVLLKIGARTRYVIRPLLFFAAAAAAAIFKPSFSSMPDIAASPPPPNFHTRAASAIA